MTSAGMINSDGKMNKKQVKKMIRIFPKEYRDDIYELGKKCWKCKRLYRPPNFCSIGMFKKCRKMEFPLIFYDHTILLQILRLQLMGDVLKRKK